MKEDYDIKISEYNELQFKMIRIHKAQDQINDLWMNPLHANLTFGCYNYELIFSLIQNLYSEVHSKCTPIEIQNTDKLISEIETFIENNSPYERNSHPCSKRVDVNRTEWLKIKKKLQELNFEVRKLLDSHGYNPDKNNVYGL